ncbi:MAG TPA: HAD family hydrolase [Terriglobales bacterium]|nr:HAD family hydrolase [Terriglobales bacterium]
MKPALPAVRAVIFDCDGVLFDSERANIAFFNEVLANIGQPPLDAQGELMAHAMAGPQLLDALFGHDPELRRRADQAARSLDYTPYFARMEPVAELHGSLARLAGRYRLAMATNRGATVPEVIRRFELSRYFELAVGTLDVPRPKPAPDMLLKCVEHFALAPEHALYVGDTPSDREAARAAGMHFVGVGKAIEAELRIGELRELPDLLI